MLKLLSQRRLRITQLSDHITAGGDVSRGGGSGTASSSNTTHSTDRHHQLRLASSSSPSSPSSRKRKQASCSYDADVSSSCRGVDEGADDVSRVHGRVDYVDEEEVDVSMVRREVGCADEEGDDVSRCNREGKALEVRRNRMEAPPDDDCCPICFGAFIVPCRGPCGHWYCGGCILHYWNYTAALQPCSCPMCSQKITKLTPEALLSRQQDAAVTEVLGNVRKYNRLFLGGPYGMILKMFELPLYIKRMFTEMMNPDRPGAHLNKLRIFAICSAACSSEISNHFDPSPLIVAAACSTRISNHIDPLQMTLGFFYSISPLDFLRIGRHNVVDLFDYSAIFLSLVLYGVGIYMRRRRLRNVRELAAIQL